MISSIPFAHFHNMYFLRSETLPSTCYILSYEYNIPFYSMISGYKYLKSHNIASVENFNQCTFFGRWSLL